MFVIVISSPGRQNPESWSITNAAALRAPDALGQERGWSREPLPAWSIFTPPVSSIACLVSLVLEIFFFFFNAVSFLVRSLLNECTGCFWHALNLHAFLMIYKEKNFFSLSLFPSIPPLFLLLDSLFLSFKKKKKNKVMT